MNTKQFIDQIMMGLCLSLVMLLAHAGKPLWTITPLTQTTIAIAANETVNIRYQVTNLSKKTATLAMNVIHGVMQITTPGNCSNPFVLKSQQSCILSLSIVGSALKENIQGGPTLCRRINKNQCFQPSSANSLNITKGPAVYTLGGTVSGLTGSLVLENNGGGELIINADGTFTFSNALPKGVPYLVTVKFQPANQYCTVANGNNTMGDENVTNVFINCVTNAPGSTTLSTSVPPPLILALAVKNTSINSALTGNARQITIQNIGTNQATGLSVVANGLPAGSDITTVPTTCSGTLAPSAMCTVTITPGPNATSTCTTGIAPTPGTITVSATNVAIPAITNVVVLGYGCQYQGGFLYSVDDATANTGSIGGKVASLRDQAPPSISFGAQLGSVIWSSNGNGSSTSDVDNRVILGIDDSSTSLTPSPSSPAYPGEIPTYMACNGISDGACNSSNILSYYNFYRVSGGDGPTPLNYYAAGLCAANINSYSGWYLPSVCEMESTYNVYTCPEGFQSMVKNLLFLIGDPYTTPASSSCNPPSGTDCLAGNYWSSTENSLFPATQAISVYFSSLLNFQTIEDKEIQLGVRCSRTLTP